MSSSERELNRTRLIFLLLLAVSIGAAFFVAHRGHLAVPQTLLTLLIGGAAPATLWVMWQTFRHTFLLRQDTKSEPQAHARVADELAETLRKQWSRESAARQSKDRIPLWVSWAAATDSAVSVSWQDLVEVAEHGPGRSPVSDTTTWAEGPDGLAGYRDDLPDVLKRVPTGWLVVLGDPGAGKTMLMLRLVLDLLARRKPGEPVPVLIPMTSWDPKTQDLNTWLEDWLTTNHPGLAVRVSADAGEQSRVAALLADQQIIPVLDGLDEMPSRARRLAISRLNDMLEDPRRPLHLVVTCRANEYKQAVGQAGHGWTPLRGGAVIELRTLDTSLVEKYLTENGEDQRWKRVVRSLGTQSRVGKALQTPLYVSLAHAIYNVHDDDTDDTSADPPDPRELWDKKSFPTTADIQDYLIRKFIPAMYRNEPRQADKAERWLAILANHLQRKRAEAENASPEAGQAMTEKAKSTRQKPEQEKRTTNLLWWELDNLAPRHFVAVVVGVICGIAAAIAAGVGSHVGVGIGVGFGTGMLIALVIGLAIRRLMPVKDAKGNRVQFLPPGPGMAGGLLGAALGGVAAGVARMLHVGHDPSLFSALPESLGIALGSGASTRAIGGFFGGLIGAFVGGLLEGIGLGLPAALVNGVGIGVAVGFAAHYVGRRKPAGKKPEWIPSIGISGGCVIGVVTGLIAWREEGVIAGLVAGIAIGAASSWPFGMRHTEQDLRVVPSPGRALAMDGRAFRYSAFSAGLAAACFGFIGGGLTSIFEIGAKVSLATIVSNGLGIGLSSGIVVGLTFGVYHAASASFLIISWWLALRYRMPWRLMRFLNDAHKKSILRQSGTEYEFRHESLKEYLDDKFHQDRTGKPRGSERDATGQAVGGQGGADGNAKTAASAEAGDQLEVSGLPDAEGRVRSGGHAGDSAMASAPSLAAPSGRSRRDAKER
jgi:GTPase SAR1 family protein